MFHREITENAIKSNGVEEIMLLLSKGHVYMADEEPWHFKCLLS